MNNRQRGNGFLGVLLMLLIIVFILFTFLIISSNETQRDNFQKYFGVSRTAVSNNMANHNTFQPVVDQRLTELKEVCGKEVSKYRDGTSGNPGTAMSKAFDDYQRAYNAARYFGFKVPETSSCQ